MNKTVLVFVCDEVMRGIFSRILEREGYQTVEVSSVDELDRKVSGKKIHGALLDFGCLLSPKELIEKVTRSPILNTTFKAAYSHTMLKEEIDAIRKKKIQAVYIGSLMSAHEIISHFLKELEA